MRQILELIDQLDNMVYEARSGPFSHTVKVDPDQVFELLDQMRSLIPDKPDFGDNEESHSAENEDGAMRRVAEKLEALEEDRRRAPAPLTAAASDQVKNIVETADRTAREVESEAREKAAEMKDAAERELDGAKAEAARVRTAALEESKQLRAEAAGVREKADSHAERVIAQAERIRSEATRSAAAVSHEQVKRMDEAAETLSQQAERAGRDFDALLESLREPAGALADLLGPAVEALREEVTALHERVAAADAPTRGLGEGRRVPAEPVKPTTPAPVPVVAESVIEVPKEPEAEPADSDKLLQDTEEFSLADLPGKDDSVAAFRLDVTDVPEFSDDEPEDEDGPNVLAEDTGDLGAEDLWRG